MVNNYFYNKIKLYKSKKLQGLEKRNPNDKHENNVC